MKYIVIVQGESTRRPGSVVEKLEAHSLEAKGAILIPVDDEPTRYGDLRWFGFESYGDGLPLTGSAVRGSVVLPCRTKHRRVHFLAELETKKGIPSGRLALAGVDSYTAIPEQIRSEWFTLPATDRSGIVLTKESPSSRVLVSGVATIMSPKDGFFQVGLQGVADGVALLWLAVTATP